MTTNATPVTCTIIACNEVDRIEKTIQSVMDVVDEIIVVDSGSTDGTQELCKRLGVKVLYHPWTGYGPQKRYAEDHATHDWILNLDADEWLSDALRIELSRTISKPIPITRSFRTKVRVVYPERDKPAPFAHFHNYIRLYNKITTRFCNSLAHDEVPETPDVVQMNNEILHKSYRNFSHIVNKTVNYYQLQYKERKKRMGVISFTLRAIFEFPFEFIKYYIIRRHIFGGYDGLCYSIALSIGRWCRIFILRGC